MKARPAYIAALLMVIAIAAFADDPQPQQRICNSILKPSWPVMIKDGFIVKPGIKPTADWMGTLEQDYVRDTSVPLVLNCWVLGWVPHKLVRAPDLPPVKEPPQCWPQRQDECVKEKP